MFKKPPLLRRKATTNATSSTPAMISGQQSERLAEQFLQQHGLRPISRNYRCSVGEIDLIMGHGELLVFVEVRYRNSRRYGSASESVNRRKQQKLIRAAEYYLQHYYSALPLPPCRFDVVAIDGVSLKYRAQLDSATVTAAGTPSNITHCSTNPPQNPIEWIPNAFTA